MLCGIYGRKSPDILCSQPSIKGDMDSIGKYGNLPPFADFDKPKSYLDI